MFPECFPDGEVPEQVTYKVIEEDQYTHHIILPALPDEFLASKVPEEQLELIANMGCGDLTYSDKCTNDCGGGVDYSERRKRPLDFLRKQNAKQDTSHDGDEPHSSEPTQKNPPFDLIRDRANRAKG